jgi:uncharacterized membrane protein YgcG
MLNQDYIHIAISQLETQKEIENLIDKFTTDEVTQRLLRENIAAAIREQNFKDEIERY